MRLGKATEQDWNDSQDLMESLRNGDVFLADKFPTLKCMFTFEKRRVTNWGLDEGVIRSCRLADGSDSRCWELKDFIYHSCKRDEGA